MKIQKKSKMIIGICIFIGAILFMVFHLKEKKEPVVFKQPPIAETQNNVNSMTADEVSDLYCGIVLMPKSMLSTIEQLSKHKLAKDIKNAWLLFLKKPSSHMIILKWTTPGAKISRIKIVSRKKMSVQT
jgi:hypothetical protein